MKIEEDVILDVILDPAAQEEKSQKFSRFWLPRTVGRLAAVQLLFLAECRGVLPLDALPDFMAWGTQTEDAEDWYTLLEENHSHRLRWDSEHFQHIIHGVAQHQEALDACIVACLPSQWSLDRLERTTLCILRCGAFELFHIPDIPRTVLFNEYINLAHALLLPRGAALINAVLDAISRRKDASLPTLEENPVVLTEIPEEGCFLDTEREEETRFDFECVEPVQ